MEYFTRDEHNLFPHAMPNISSCSPVASTTVVSHRLFPTNFVYRSESESISRTLLAHYFIVEDDSRRSSHGTNKSYDKKITIRYTMDGWFTHFELPASFSHKLFGNEDIDAFSFALAIPHQTESTERMTRPGKDISQQRHSRRRTGSAEFEEEELGFSV
ncbi:hypothetical protein PRIPAC_87400 [Pristionchus pacificus]|uniref:CBM21 domain-containing protein n=1 Tax=Pristionchus pacificus TaxID=54126 RepID=A0A2A6CVH5_PRIPA|nr:hypothetical protein PRIPAC_87400 [Pristionchus pacificus]|eukprot:PDM82185.1 hypothetical protein PRIPAC_36578 [Pristionchus pacificus]